MTLRQSWQQQARGVAVAVAVAVVRGGLVVQWCGCLSRSYRWNFFHCMKERCAAGREHPHWHLILP